jgi:hypothetical protein
LAGILRKKKRRRFSSIEDGIYLDELDGGNFNEEEIAKYFPKPHLSNQPSPPTYRYYACDVMIEDPSITTHTAKHESGRNPHSFLCKIPNYLEIKRNFYL